MIGLSRIHAVHQCRSQDPDFHSCSIGVTISPGLLIGFVVNSAKDLQPKLIGVFSQSGMTMPTSTAGNSSMGKQFEALQNADVTTIVNQLKDIFRSFLPPKALEEIEKMRTTLENVFQATMNTGYKHMFTAVAIISVIGLVATLFLSKKAVLAEVIK